MPDKSIEVEVFFIGDTMHMTIEVPGLPRTTNNKNVTDAVKEFAEKIGYGIEMYGDGFSG